MITSGIVANKIVVGGRLINDGNNCVRAVDEKTGAFGDVMGCAKLATFDGVDALDQVFVDPTGLLLGDPVYTSLRRFDGNIYDLGHGVVLKLPRRVSRVFFYGVRSEAIRQNLLL